MNCSVHLIIKGKVQGVFYRAVAQQTAMKLDVTGWIKNTDEGNVEAIITGTRKSIDQFIDWCRTGPSNAKVSEVIIKEKVFTSFNTFEIRK